VTAAPMPIKSAFRKLSKMPVFRLKSGFACISRRRPAFYFSDSRADTPDENVPRNGKPYGSPCSEA